MIREKQHLASGLLVGGLLFVAALALSADWSWLAGLLIAYSAVTIASKSLS